MQNLGYSLGEFLVHLDSDISDFPAHINAQLGKPIDDVDFELCQLVLQRFDIVF